MVGYSKQALLALKLLKEYLPRAYAKGAKDPVVREKLHNAATIAGIAFSNAFLGVCHSMAHTVRSSFYVCWIGWHPISLSSNFLSLI